MGRTMEEGLSSLDSRRRSRIGDAVAWAKWWKIKWAGQKRFFADTCWSKAVTAWFRILNGLRNSTNSLACAPTKDHERTTSARVLRVKEIYWSTLALDGDQGRQMIQLTNSYRMYSTDSPIEWQLQGSFFWLTLEAKSKHKRRRRANQTGNATTHLFLKWGEAREEDTSFSRLRDGWGKHPLGDARVSQNNPIDNN